MADQNAPALTEAQMKSIRDEAEQFEKKSLELVVSAPALSAHYNRLFKACQPSLKRLARMEQVQRRKTHAESMKKAKEQAKASPASKPNRPS